MLSHYIKVIKFESGKGFGIFSNDIETSDEESTRIPQDEVTNPTSSLQLTNAEIAGLISII